MYKWMGEWVGGWAALLVKYDCACRGSSWAAVQGVWTGLLSFSSPGQLSKADKELIIVVISLASRCPYSVVVHSAQYRVYSKNPVLADQVSARLSCASFRVSSDLRKGKSTCYCKVQRTHVSSSSHCLRSLSVAITGPPASVCARCLGLEVNWAPALCQTWYWILDMHSLKCIQLPL